MDRKIAEIPGSSVYKRLSSSLLQQYFNIKTVENNSSIDRLKSTVISEKVKAFKGSIPKSTDIPPDPEEMDTGNKNSTKLSTFLGP